MEQFISKASGRRLLYGISFEDIKKMLREQDRRPVRNLMDFLLETRKDSWFDICLRGSAVEGNREYGDIDLLANYGDIRGKEKSSERLNHSAYDSSVYAYSLGERDFKFLDLGKTKYCLTSKDGKTHLNGETDKIFLLEPCYISPSMGVLPTGSQIELSLTTLPNFLSDYEKEKRKK